MKSGTAEELMNDKRTLIIENIAAVDIDSTVKLAFRDGDTHDT